MHHAMQWSIRESVEGTQRLGLVMSTSLTQLLHQRIKCILWPNSIPFVMVLPV